LPLAFSSIIVGSFINYRTQFNWLVFGLALFTALLLQVLSNLANDYGDSKKGTDNDSRIGPQRAIQSGKLSFKEMKIAIIINVILCLFSGISLVIIGIGTDFKSILLISVGLLAIVAAIKYTVGKFAFGYNGLGDLFVMIFFGFVGVLGAAFLQIQSLNLFDFIIAFSIGCFATGVLNLNNMRDYLSDKASNKNTLVVKIGPKWAVRYHIVLIIVGMVAAFYFIFETALYLNEYLPVLVFPFMFIQLKQIETISNPKDYDPFLKKLALSAFAFSIFFAISKIIA
jgi:1,4-dihydroxy-2-naphthoate octaprenyltransferase